MRSKIESIIINAYHHGAVFYPDLSHDIREGLSKWARVSKWTDPLDKTHWRVELKPSGDRRARFILIKRGHKKSPKRGVALERNRWVAPEGAKLRPESFQSLSDRADVPCRIENDWRPCASRVIVTDLDTLLTRLSNEVDWESHRNTDLLRSEGWSRGEVRVWEYLDNPSIRREAYILPDTHFVIWNQG